LLGAILRRVTGFLPIGTEEDLDAAVNILEWLRELRDELPELSVTGGTSSLLRPPVFDGFYYSEDRGRWVEEAVSMFVIDVPYAADMLNDFILLLETEFSNFYVAANSKQDEIGLSVSELIYTTYDLG
jgi:hypothetical protein